MSENEICQERSKWLASKFKASKALNTSELFRDTDILMLGETHYTEACKQYPKLLETLANGGGATCLFLEFNPSMYSMMKEAPADSPLKCFKDLDIKAKELNMKVFPIDLQGMENNRSHYLTSEGENERDAHMEREVISHKAECKHSILLIGKEHISSTKEKRIPLAERMKRSFRIRTVNLQNTGARLAPFTNSDSSWTYNDLCKPPSEAFENFAVFENTSAPSHMDLIPGEGKWADFDYTLMFK